MAMCGLKKLFAKIGKSCIWGRCNGTLGADGRCNRCGSKRP